MILWQAGFRYLWRHPLQVLFAVIGVSVGVAVVVAIDMANSSAERAFRISADALSGRATHMIVNSSGDLSEEIYPQLRMGGGWRDSAPVVEGYAAIPEQPGLLLNIVGIDPFTERPFRSYSPSIGSQFDLSRLLTEEGAGLMTERTASRLGLTIGDSLQLSAGEERHHFILVGFVETREQISIQALDNILLMDISSAQEILNKHGKLSRIDLIIPDTTSGQRRMRQLQHFLPSYAEILPANARVQTMAQMTKAFQINLRALSLLALVVGMFLIYNTMTFSILQRRTLLGTLRTLGVTRGQIFAMVLIEAILIGTIGTAIGLLIGFFLANGLLSIVTRTINDLYFVLNVDSLFITPLALTKSMLLGVGASAVAAFIPALEAGRTSPRAVLMRSNVESRHRRLLPWAVTIGLFFMSASLLGLNVPSKNIIASFLLMFTLIIGYALVTPGAFVWLLKTLQPVSQYTFGILGKIAVRNLMGGLSRTGVATSALVIAVAASVGVGLMINSFRATVDQWLRSYLQADIYVTTASTGFEPGRIPLEDELVNALAKVEGVKFITKARHIRLESQAGPSELFIAEINRQGFDGYWFDSGDKDEIYKAFSESDSVIVSEPYAYHRNLKRGDSITLRTDRGQRRFQIAGIFTDYGSDRGRITMSRQLYTTYWNDKKTDALGIYVKDGYDVDQTVNDLVQTAGERQQLIVYSNSGLREASLATFDRTFAVTSVLRMLAVLVAFVGILNALMAMQIERARELAILRAGGLTPQQLWHLVIGETSLVGLIAGLLALPLGIVQALVLILVINQRSFGWSMQISIDPVILLQALGLSVFAALLAGIYPAWLMSRTSPALAMRYE
ncbi:MAG: ABC transporter permease [Deltaproteobacteria bacterium]|jgi:putative ABC transport system permease protein|nr:ABC transporter permease [Deltaproteobacteria bacterium]